MSTPDPRDRTPNTQALLISKDEIETHGVIYLNLAEDKAREFEALPANEKFEQYVAFYTATALGDGWHTVQRYGNQILLHANVVLSK